MACGCQVREWAGDAIGVVSRPAVPVIQQRYGASRGGPDRPVETLPRGQGGDGLGAGADSRRVLRQREVLILAVVGQRIDLAERHRVLCDGGYQETRLGRGVAETRCEGCLLFLRKPDGEVMPGSGEPGEVLADPGVGDDEVTQRTSASSGFPAVGSGKVCPATMPSATMALSPSRSPATR